MRKKEKKEKWSENHHFYSKTTSSKQVQRCSESATIKHLGLLHKPTISRLLSEGHTSREHTKTGLLRKSTKGSFNYTAIPWLAPSSHLPRSNWYSPENTYFTGIIPELCIKTPLTCSCSVQSLQRQSQNERRPCRQKDRKFSHWRGVINSGFFILRGIEIGSWSGGREGQTECI